MGSQLAENQSNTQCFWISTKMIYRVIQNGNKIALMGTFNWHSSLLNISHQSLRKSIWSCLSKLHSHYAIHHNFFSPIFKIFAKSRRYLHNLCFFLKKKIAYEVYYPRSIYTSHDHLIHQIILPYKYRLDAFLDSWKKNDQEIF